MKTVFHIPAGFEVGYPDSTPLLHTDKAIELTVKDHSSSITLLMGDNGMGKTTFLRSLIGLHTSPSSLDWKLLSGPIGYLPDEIDYSPEITPRLLLTSFSSRSKANQLLDELGWQIEWEKPFYMLSKGNRQKVRFLASLLFSEEALLFLMDEPFSGFDIKTRSSTLEWLIRRFTHSDRHLILSLHAETIPSGIGGGILKIENGKIHYIPS
ncbi:MAG: ATP-binding cassette domain-containing protein [Verrucomicrobiota bacterium]